MCVIKKFGIDFHSSGGALTLPVEAVSESDVEGGTHTRTHSKTGWTITGKVYEDYFVWVNDFEATHERFGSVAGNFEGEVKADNEEGFASFMASHPPMAWDYGDI